jgi:ligand-binding sensor domain-containing protein
MALIFSIAAGAQQQLVFRQLGIEEGLPSNLVHNACFDSSGLIWAGTYDGLVGYDGTRIKQYLVETHPALPDNDIGNLHCDHRNRIWICTGKGLAMLDEQRRMKRIVISDTLKNPDVDYCVDVQGLGIIAFTPGKTYLLREGKTNWEPYTWFDAEVKKKGGINHIRAFNRNAYVLMVGTRALLVDFSAQKTLVDINIAGSGRNSICKISDRELLVANGIAAEWYLIDITSKSIVKKYKDVRDEEGKLIESPAYSCALAANGIVYITTRTAGLIGFDPFTEKINIIKHDPLNARRISSDNLTRIYCHPNGFMMVCSAEGLNFTNTLTPILRQEHKFVADDGEIIDGPSIIGEDGKGRIWILSYNKLFLWNPITNRAKNITPPGMKVEMTEATEPSGSICRDAQTNMWVGYDGTGLMKFNSDGKALSFMDMNKTRLPTNRIRIIRLLNDNRLAIGAQDGFFIINPLSLQIDTLQNDPLLKQAIGKKRIIDILPDGDGIWIAASPRGGAYYYNFKTKLFKALTEKEGLSNNRVYCIGKDLLGNTYIGTYNGLNILDKDGNISYINKQNGLRHFRVDNIATDKRGRLWITNYNTLLCYNPDSKSFSYFDEQNGVSNAGFAVSQRFFTKNGNILFSNSGVLFVDTTINTSLQLKSESGIAINRVYDDGAYDLVKNGSVISLKHNEAKVTLYYLTDNLLTANRLFYRYKMDNLDTGWQQPTRNNQVTYNLKPGKYVFQIQTSYNESEWKESQHKITVMVSSPWWQTWWFRVAAVCSVILLAWLFYRSRIRTVKTKAAITQQMAELEGKALRAQMNPHFIFNSLNAIQELIVTENYDGSYQYLSKFSKLLRMVLNNSEKNFIPLSSEIEMNSLYLELESLRFKQSFHYSITTDKSTDAEGTEFPSLLLQPFIENAIWHGLMHKEGEKKLAVQFITESNMLTCTIEDNGIGRQMAGEIKAKKLGAHHFTSKGTELAQHRMELLRQSGINAVIATTDKYDYEGKAAGTVVEIKIPLQKTTE